MSDSERQALNKSNVCHRFQLLLNRNRRDEEMRNSIRTAIGSDAYAQLSEAAILNLLELFETSWDDGYFEGDQDTRSFFRVFKEANGRPAESFAEASDWFDGPAAAAWFEQQIAKRSKKRKVETDQ